MSIQAAVCREFGAPLVVESLEIGPPQNGEVSVRLAACAICHSDIHAMDGVWGGTLPAVYGHEASGIVAAVGADVTGLEPGDHVVVTLIRACGRCYFCDRGEPYLCEGSFALDRVSRLRDRSGRPVVQGLRTGAFAEQVVVHASQVVRIPREIPLDSASLLACGVITGLGAVTKTAAVPAGSSVIVIGAGGVGLNSIQGAALAGGRPIIALDLVDGKLAAAREFGATHAVNAAAGDVRERVRALTGGRGADFVFVTVGSSRASEQGLTLLRRSGTLVIVGMPATGDRVSLEAGDFAGDGQRILGSKMGSARIEIDIPRLVDLYREGILKLDELITGRYPLEQINEAIASVRTGEALRNVIVFS